MKNILVLTLLVLFGCSKNPDTLTLNLEIQSLKSYDISDIINDDKVDILWVIDDSGSMSDIQENVASNLELFMNEFVLETSIRWKMGIVTTDDSAAPKLGFDSSFDYNHPDPVAEARSVIRSIGTGGSGSEHSFYNAKRAIDDYPSFLRPGAHFVVVFVTDEREQSAAFPHNYNTESFLKDMRGHLKIGRIFRTYGVLDLKGIADCEGYSSYTDKYEGSQFQEAINQTSGFYVPGCQDFGHDLTRIAEDIINLVDKPRVLLREKPVIDTIRVSYRGVELFPGLPKDGGSWFYDDVYNTINFYDTQFVNEDGDGQFLEIDFEVDDYDN